MYVGWDLSLYSVVQVAVWLQCFIEMISTRESFDDEKVNINIQCK